MGLHLMLSLRSPNVKKNLARECASIAERFLCNRKFDGISYYTKKYPGESPGC